MNQTDIDRARRAYADVEVSPSRAGYAVALIVNIAERMRAANAIVTHESIEALAVEVAALLNVDVRDIDR